MVANPILFCVLEYPGQGDGILGRFYKKLLRSTDVSWDDVWTTWAYKCSTAPVKPKAADRDACKHWLSRELLLAEPSLILTFGAVPTSLLLSKPGLKLDDVLYQSVERKFPWGASRILACPSMEKLTKGKMTDVQKCVGAIKECLE